MDMKLSENIRTFRKGRKLTQEQLAEVRGFRSRTSVSSWRWRTFSTPPWTFFWAIG